MTLYLTTAVSNCYGWFSRKWFFIEQNYTETSQAEVLGWQQIHTVFNNIHIHSLSIENVKLYFHLQP